MSLHIGLDGSRIAKAHYTGTEQYSHAIFTHLFKVAPHHRYTIYAPAKPTHPLDTGRARVDWRIIPFPRLWTQLRLSLEFLTTRDQPDVLFVPSHTIPLIHPKATVTTVHDLGFHHQPHFYGRIERLYQQFGLAQAVQASTRIIAVSEATKDDLVRFTQYPTERITVIHHGVDHDRYRPPTVTEQPPRHIANRQPYLYTVGRLEAKKQTPQLIRAFRTLKERYGVPHRLVLAGQPGAHGYAEVQAALQELPPSLRSDVIELGYVSDSDHAKWLRFADCFVFPSGFEGFGLPVLEAMASDVPVVTSRASSLPEVVGSAGLLVNQTSSDAIAEGVVRIVSHPSLRAQLIAAGRARLKHFSWERAALATIGVIEAAAKEVMRAN
ncbi:glycosyltransferase family 4 protein [Candidatus Berkelbacteria bacterium]|nr:glycosyltransferase family 4 protein [Candidatus Berkelbacteria bacterium]